MTNETKLYELMFLVPGSVSVDEADKAFKEVKEEIATLGGGVHSEESWGRRQLAYQVAKSDYGYYFVVRTNLEPAKTQELSNFCRLHRDIARFLVIALPADYTPVDYSEVKTKFGGRVKEETPEAEGKADVKKPAPKVEEKVEEKKEEKSEPKKEVKSEKNLDDILSDLDAKI